MKLPDRGPVPSWFADVPVGDRLPLRRLVCRIRGCAWTFTTDHADYVHVQCARCGAFPVWRAP